MYARQLNYHDLERYSKMRLRLKRFRIHSNRPCLLHLGWSKVFAFGVLTRLIAVHS